MTRDLPLDGDDAEVSDPSGDAAYRVATGVARVARAGAYVTGGALIASNAGGTPSDPGGQRLDSWHTGWAGNNDPDPDVPSPVVTFPDPAPNSVPVFPSRPAQTSSEHTILAGGPPEASSGGAPAPARFASPSHDAIAGYDGTDAFLGAPSFLDTAPGYDIPAEQSWSAHTADGALPEWWGSTNQPAAPGPGFGLPDAGAFLNPGANPGANLFGLARHPVADETRVGELADTVDDNPSHFGLGHSGFGHSGFGHSGYSPWAGSHPFDGAGTDGAFDGIGDFGVYVGVDASMSLYTEFEIDFGIGPNGAYLTTGMKVEAAAQLSVKTAAGTDVGQQIDNLSSWLDSKSPTTAGRTGTDQHASGVPGLTGPTSAAPAGVAPVPPPAPAPIVVSPAPAPIAVPPAPAAPALPAAAVAAAPVVATPLQTTIQPEAATSPIANVLAGPTGPSPLTAPAAAVPLLFEHQDRPTPTTPVAPTPTDTAVDPAKAGLIPVTKIPTTITATVPTPTSPGGNDTSDSGTVATPGSVVTKTPGVNVKPDTDVEVTVTKMPGVTATVPVDTTTTRSAHPSTPDDEVTAPGTGGTDQGAAESTAPTRTQPTVPTHTESTAPTHTRPSVDAPTADVPTVSVPTTQPPVTHSVPAQATIQPTADVPSLDVPTANVPAPVHPAPVTPIKPTKPIGDHFDASHGYAAAQYVPDADHSALVYTAGGLSSGLLPDVGLFDAHTEVHGTFDHHLLI